MTRPPERITPNSHQTSSAETPLTVSQIKGTATSKPVDTKINDSEEATNFEPSNKPLLGNHVSSADLLQSASNESSHSQGQTERQQETTSSQTQAAPLASQKNFFKDNKQSIIGTIADLNVSAPTDCFVQLVSCERRLTRDGKPFYKVTFRDARQSIQAILWKENPLFRDCQQYWKKGGYYKIRGIARNTNYGIQLDILRIRGVTPDDKKDGFSKNKCRPSSAIPPETTTAEILALASQHLNKTPLLLLVRKIFKDNRIALYESPASRSHHRAYIGGLLEHTLSVTKLAILLSDHFCSIAPQGKSTIYKPLVVAGAILHDIGKILDTQMLVTGPKHTLAGDLIGHAILGVEIIQRYSIEVGLDNNLRTQLSHLILSHSRFQDWGAPMPPSSLEAMILHYADYADSTFASSLKLLLEDSGDEFFTERKGPFGVPILKNIFSPFDEEANSKTEQLQSNSSDDDNKPNKSSDSADSTDSTHSNN